MGQFSGNGSVSDCGITLNPDFFMFPNRNDLIIYVVVLLLFFHLDKL